MSRPPIDKKLFDRLNLQVDEICKELADQDLIDLGKSYLRFLVLAGDRGYVE